MDNFKTIQDKLERFIKRYHINELLKGAILFFAIGVLYFLFTLLLEHFLWLGTTSRTVLFWVFIVVELALLTKFIVLPLAKLFKLKKGIDYTEAAQIIGEHFPEVDDKLLNVIQLKNSKDQSDLLLASINQKAIALNPIPFKLAVNFKHNISYLKYAILPVAVVLLVYFTGHFSWFKDSYKRVVDYKTAYEPPAPFQFFVLNNNLQAVEGKDFKLMVKTAGAVVPENAQITYNNETYVLQQTGVGAFEYVFSQPQETTTFNFSANTVSSKPYTLDVIETPSLLSFKMFLDYPKHTKKKDAVFKGTGNAMVPEGTKVTWQLQTKSTENVLMYAEDTLKFSLEQKNAFKASKQLFNTLNYTLSTSNKNLKDYENLSFAIDVVKDEFPELNVQMKVDSLDLQTLYFYGQVSDDYGLSKLQLVYYPTNAVSKLKTKSIPITASNISDFISAFPDNLEIASGVPYQLYFEVFDNDAVNAYKSKKSPVFNYRKRTQNEEKDKQLDAQNKSITDLNKSLQKFEEQEKRLDELSRTGKEKKSLNFNDKKKLASFFKRQEQQDQILKNFNKKFQDNLEKFEEETPVEKDPLKEDLKKRLKDNEEQLKKDEKTLEELKKIQDKISNEELIKKLDDVAKQNKNKKRSLQQLLELTKRFYVEKKLEKLTDDLKKLSEAQEKLSKAKEEENTKEKQDAINDAFKTFQEELEKLKEESKALKKPVTIPQDKIDEKEVKDEQQKASETLEKKEQQDAKETPQTEAEKKEQKQRLQKAQESQKKAAQKMQQMHGMMQNMMQSMSGEQMQEDTEMLRQVLDNLVLFSFDEEALMEQFKSITVNHNKYASYLKQQSYLREHFEHIDDSLFALSLRQPKLSETVNKEIADVFFNIDKSLEQLAENQIYQGVSKQQFAVTAANNLADILSDVLDNMQESMSMSMGSGGQGEMQLPDIIMSQEQLEKMMQQGLKQGEQGQPKSEDGKKEGKGQKEGEGEKQGEGEKEGKGQKKDGKGKDGAQGKSGENGKSGKDGSQKGGEGEGNNEGENNALLYEIYKQQQQLRQALNERLKKEGKGGLGQRLSRQMEDIELDLLNKGFTQQTLEKMTALKHQLLKMENATFQQGEDNKRESKTNRNTFGNATKSQIPNAKQYFKTTEILNRQALPLQPSYKKKVQNYFKSSN